MALSTTVSLVLRAIETSSLDLATASATHAKSFSDTLASGTSADQADLAWSDTRTLAASATENIDVAGSLTGGLGAAVVMVELVAILVIAAAANTNDVVVGNGTNPIVGGPFGVAGANTINVAPGGVFFFWNPKNPAVAITASTGDILKVANSAAGTGVTYDIVLIGRSA